MFCCQPTGIPEDATEFLRKTLTAIKVLTYVLLACAILEFFISFLSALNMLILCILLHLIRYTKNFQMSVMCSVLFLIALTIRIIEAGTFYSHEKINSNREGFIVFYQSLFIPLYLVITYYTYLSYKELKAVLMSNSGDYPLENLSGRAQRSFTPFVGEGFRTG